MKCQRFLFVGLVLLLGMLSANAWAGALQAYQIIVTGGYTCDGVYRTQNWTNTTGSPVFIKRAELLMLSNLDAIVNLNGVAVRLSDSSLLLTVGWNHYANPTTLHQHSVDFSPDYFLINPGDTLQLLYFCEYDLNRQANQALTIWYTVGSP